MKRKAFRPRKRFGQNFLHDPAIARKILNAADLPPGATVVELGAGKGFLTRPLVARGVRLIALELDRDLHRDLSADIGEVAGDRVELLNVDFTDVTIRGLLESRGIESCVLLGNIPYHLTREVLFSFLVDEHDVIEAGYLMMQREVGERIVAPPGSRTYGIPSVVLQSLYEVQTLFHVSPGSFVPRPRVSSSVLGFVPLPEPFLDAGELAPFTVLVKNVFQQRRKTLHKSLRAFYSLSDDELGQVEDRAGVDLQSRPEALSRESFRALYRAVADIGTAG